MIISELRRCMPFAKQRRNSIVFACDGTNFDLTNPKLDDIKLQLFVVNLAKWLSIEQNTFFFKKSKN